MQVIGKELSQLVDAMAPCGNFFFLLTAQELRREGLSFLAFYVLQRAIEERDMSEYWVRSETGFPAYEVSRACKLLVGSGLLDTSRSERDGRVRVLKETSLGRKVHRRILQAASKRLAEGIPPEGRLRRISIVTERLGQANAMLLGPLQLSFFDTDLFPQEKTTKKKQRRPGKTS